MTSNQIAAAANAENVRHNQTTEVETNRHNTVVEQLTADQNAINAEKNVITATYNQQMVDIQREYNTKYLQMQQALGSEKNQIQRELNLIEKDKNEKTATYQRRMSDIAYQEADIRRQATAEDKRHNLQTEANELRRLEEGSFYERRMAEINAFNAKSEDTYRYWVIENQKTRNANDFAIATASNLLRQQENEIKALNTQVDIYRALIDASLKNKSMWVNSATQLMSSTIQAASKVGASVLKGR